MSAYIVDQGTMSKVINGVERLIKDSPGYWVPKLTGRSCQQYLANLSENDSVNLEQIGDRLFVLNRDAVYARYEGRHETDAPAPIYKYQRSLCTAIQAFKAMKCLRYQCSEGDIDTRPDYQLLEAMIGSLAEQIIQGLPEYDLAGWG